LNNQYLTHTIHRKIPNTQDKRYDPHTPVRGGKIVYARRKTSIKRFPSLARENLGKKKKLGKKKSVENIYNMSSIRDIKTDTNRRPLTI
jgi:hypothetical protein